MERNKRLAQKYPFCAHCLKAGRYRPGTQTDHIKPLYKGGVDRESNLQRLCDDCHDIKTQVDMGHRHRVRTGVDGWPIEE